jgi:hypothetical protein
MSNVPLPRPGPLGLIQYAGVDMLQYAGEISAAKDAEIAQLRAELIKSLADNAALRERVEALERDALRLKHVRDNGLQIRTRQFKRKTWYAVGNLAQQEYDYHLTLEAAIDAAMKGEV